MTSPASEPKKTVEKCEAQNQTRERRLLVEMQEATLRKVEEAKTERTIAVTVGATIISIAFVIGGCTAYCRHMHYEAQKEFVRKGLPPEDLEPAPPLFKD